MESDGSISLSSNILGDREFTLTKAELTDLLSLIENTDFTRFDAVYEARTSTADFFAYRLEVKKRSKAEQVEWVDDWASKNPLPDELKEVEEHMISIIHGTGHGGVEGTVSDEFGRPVANLAVSIVNGSVGFPEIAVITNDDGFYQIGSVPPGVFTIGVHDENGERIGQKTAYVRGGETSTLDITVRGHVAYEYYGGVGLFKEGIYVIATDTDPMVMYGTAKLANINDYWRMLKDEVTQDASTTDFISILMSRGDFTSGGYLIQIKSHVWLESYPVVCFFNVNFTDPGEGVEVTEALTNPLVLVTIGNLSAGRYIARAHIDSFILTYDTTGKPVYTPVKTLKEEVWETEFEIS